MSINHSTGLLETARYVQSPHCDLRSANTIDMVVIHGISLPPNEFGTEAIEHFFCGKLEHTAHPYFMQIKDLRVSAHLLIDRKGGVIQFVPFHLRAWHAGQSAFKGQTGCNDFSIGIELEGTDNLPYEDIQYRKLANIISLLYRIYPDIVRERIVGHSDIAPGRKTDPGPFFDWTYLDCLLSPAPS